VSGSTLTIEGTSQAQGITVRAPDSSTVAVSDGGELQLAGAGGISIDTTGGVVTVDASTINNAINIDGGSSSATYGGTTAINGGTSA
jgi:exopolysaccharide biosynthesis protein